MDKTQEGSKGAHAAVVANNDFKGVAARAGGV